MAQKFNAAIGPNNPKDQVTLEASMKIKYRASIGELIWAMTTCRPNIAYTSIKLSQSNLIPAEHHYHGLKHAIRYLYMTRNDGIYFWQTPLRPDLPDGPLPTINSNARDLLLDNQPDHEASIAIAYGNSDWATCVKTHCLFSSICIKLAGGTIAYKTKLQPTVALSSTKAKFMAACDVNRMSLYICSILWDLDVPQEAATIAYKDNDGCTAMGNAQKPKHELGISISNTLPYMIGSNVTSSTLKGSTPPSILLIILPNHSPGYYSITTLISYSGTFLQNTPRYTSMQLLHTVIV
jgi:hypothetical protein